MSRRSSNLTIAEMKILRLACSGLSAAEVAKRCCLSPRTVHFHLRNVYQKLEVDNLIGAYNVAMQRGLVEPPERT